MTLIILKTVTPARKHVYSCTMNSVQRPNHSVGLAASVVFFLKYLLTDPNTGAAFMRTAVLAFIAYGLIAAGSLKAELPADQTEHDPQDWTMYNYDLVGSRHNRGETALAPNNVSDLIEKWRFPAEDYQHQVGVIHATPTVVNGYVYFGTATYPAFYKLSPNGSVKWKYKIGEGSWELRQSNRETRFVPGVGVYNSALAIDRFVYFADANGVIYALDRKTGAEQWTVDSRSDNFPGNHPANVFLASPILADGRLIVGGGAYEHAAVLQPGYKCCRGRGCVVALDPDSGQIRWKYDVGPPPQKFDPPAKIKAAGVVRTYYYGPSTSSVWSTPSYDEATHTIFFGTDVHNAPRKPTKDDPRNYTRHSAAIIALDARDGAEKWVTQLTTEDVWNHTLPTYDNETGKYKDQSIGDTPKIYSLSIDGQATTVVGVGSKNGGFYVLRADDGEVLFQTPLYTGPPMDEPTVNARTLALPSAIGGLQTGCATDGTHVFTNGIDALKHFPTGGRVASITLDSRSENWRHERKRIPKVPRRGGKPFKDVGDPIASGIAVANGVIYFTTLVSNRLVALDASSGELLKEIDLGSVFSGPSVSRGRVYVGTGNTLWSPFPNEDFYPKRYTGTLISFGLPGEDAVDQLGSGDE